MEIYSRPHAFIAAFPRLWGRVAIILATTEAKKSSKTIRTPNNAMDIVALPTCMSATCSSAVAVSTTLATAIQYKDTDDD